jgi:hypothetical protein
MITGRRPSISRQLRAAMVAAVPADEVNRSNPLADLAARIRAEHQATVGAMRNCLEHAMAAGDLLLEARAQIPHGRWLPWLAGNCNASDVAAREGGILVSLLLQHGCPVGIISHALSRKSDGSASGVIGAVLDRIAEGPP